MLEFHTLGDLPTAPFYGEVPGAGTCLLCSPQPSARETDLLIYVVDFSPKCGSCWKLEYDGREPIYMVGVDNAAMFQLGKEGFEKFAGRKGFDKGSVIACKVTEVSPEHCHLPPPKKW